MPSATKIEKDSVLAKRFYASAKKQAEDDAEIISNRMKDVDEGRTRLISSEEFHKRLKDLRVRG
ncbi:MAG: hypothetical protein LBN36_06435 [Clostridiales Family XIII bacterium]|nr:hypothetical protein [Clostridiales Family XIII bacterium]